MADFRDILVQLRADLAQAVGDSSKIKVTNRRTPPNLTGGYDVLVRVGRPTPIQGINDASGRTNLRIVRYVKLHLRTRQDPDVVGDDLQWFADGDKGSVGVENLILNVMHNWVPTIYVGSSLQPLLEEPARFVDPGEDPTRDLPAAPDGMWGQTSMILEIKYRQDLGLVDTDQELDENLNPLPRSIAYTPILLG